MNWWIANRTWIANRWNAKRESLNRESRETADSESRIAETQLWNAETQSYKITRKTQKQPVNQVHYWYLCLIKGPDKHTRFKADIVHALAQSMILNRESRITETHYETRNAETRIAETLKRAKRETLKRETLLCETRDSDTSALNPKP